MSARISSIRSRGGRATSVAAVLLLSFAGCAGPRAQTKAEHPKEEAPTEAPKATPAPEEPAAKDEQVEPITIEMDPAVMKSSSAVAWLVYGGVVAPARKLALVEKRPIDWFGTEVAGRSAAAHAWRDAKVKPGEDPYLDALVKVEDAGFMAEYVARYIVIPGFSIDGKRAAALRLDAFLKWAAPNLGDKHRGELHANVLVEGRAFPPALGEDANRPAQLRDVSECALLAGRLAANAKEWRAQIEKMPEVVVAARDRGEFASLLRDAKLRPRIAEKGIRWASPDLNDAFIVAGFCAIENNRSEEAEQYFQTELALNPLHVKAATELAHVYVMQKRWDDAMRLTEDLMARVDDECVKALLWRKKGFILFELLRLREARDAYLKSLEFEPGNEMALSEIRLIDQQRGAAGGESAPADKNEKEAKGAKRTKAAGGAKGGAQTEAQTAAGDQMPGAVPPSLTVRTKCQDRK